MFKGEVLLIDSQGADVDEHSAFDFSGEGGTFSRRSDDDISKISSIVERWQIGLIERLIHGVGQVERLFEVCF